LGGEGGKCRHTRSIFDPGRHPLDQIGAQVEDEPVVVDHNWITSRKPADLEAFSDKIIEELKELEGRGLWPQTESASQMSV